MNCLKISVPINNIVSPTKSTMQSFQMHVLPAKVCGSFSLRIDNGDLVIFD